MYCVRHVKVVLRKVKLLTRSENKYECSGLLTNIRHYNCNSSVIRYSIQSIARPSHRLVRPVSCLLSARMFHAKEQSDTKLKKPQSLADELLASKLSEKNNDKKEENSSQSEKEERERTLRALKFSYYAFGFMITAFGITLIVSYGSPLQNENGVVVDEFSDMPIIQQYLYRTASGIRDVNKMIQEPTREKLLPDTLKEPYFQPPYTLVLEMKDILVHPEWTYSTGWRFKKRPGVDFLLQQCGPPLFEIVIYTSEQGFTAYPVIEQLDTNSLIWYKLFKDSTRYVDGKHLKDLNHLNRDLQKVIVVDWDKDAITTPRNQLCLEKWKGNMDDQTLVDLAILLKTIADSEVDDVRGVLDYYKSFDDPIQAFRENQRAAQLQEQELKQNPPSTGYISSWTSSFLRKK